jgi:hypothetical protein
MYAHEEDEWRREVAGMSEMRRAATELDVRRTIGMSGDVEDANDR